MKVDYERGKGKANIGRSTMPTLRFAEIHKLYSIVKVADLQSLVLYYLADGPAP